MILNNKIIDRRVYRLFLSVFKGKGGICFDLFWNFGWLQLIIKQKVKLISWKLINDSLVHFGIIMLLESKILSENQWQLNEIWENLN